VTECLECNGTGYIGDEDIANAPLCEPTDRRET